ncbi:DoxX family protein [Ensifer sp.]|uniref:DoxX family protein n=1 Tax=Ensifer sp. TaxID=1872086 RepID=UPI000DD9B3E0|nr:DoxX family protein [Ensifer sp.]
MRLDEFENADTSAANTRFPQEPRMSQNVVVLIGRILLSIMFITAGFGKLTDPAGTAGMITNAGWPAATALAYLAGIFELVAGLAVLVGFQTRIAAYLLALFCLVTAFVFHSGAINIPTFPPEANGLLSVFNSLMMMKNISVAGGFLVLAAFGPGALSVDARRA